MRILKQTTIGYTRCADGAMATVTQNLWDSAPVDYLLSWNDADGYYRSERRALCPLIERWQIGRPEQVREA